MALFLTRRQKLSACVGALGVAMLGRSSVTLADQSAVDLLIRQFSRGKNPIAGRVKLDLPATNEEGSAVVVSVSVDVPSNSYVTDVLVVADGNKRPDIVTFHFSPMSVAEATTKIRLAAGTQRVTAVARLNDGACHAITNTTTVKNAGCM